ncbi:MAG: hypothetical protein JEZ02_13600 [Desulfatibacillum sp.]|nr:hypothetical protein [Desulfatibacillum sp.]
MLSKTNFDPAVLWQWGTMQAMALIKVLKTVEEKFGAEGQKLVLDSLWQVGYDIGRQITENTLVPDDMSTGEWLSFYATVINRIAYASLETALIDSEEKASFHIDWCPHQDHYKPFDCRVQRYFVQGMIDASTDFMESQGREKVWDVEFKSTIPSGAETCFFTMEKGGPDQKRKWGEFTRLIEEKALDLAAKRKAEKD